MSEPRFDDSWWERYGTGRCVNCGFLAKQGFVNAPAQPQNRVKEEAGFLDRERGELYELADGFSAQPVCFRRVFPIQADAILVAIAQTHSPKVLPSHAAEVIKRARDCPKWTRWQEGFTPKEHLEELRMLQLEQRQREHDLKQAEIQAGIASQNRDISAALLAVQKQSNEQSDKTARLALLIALAAILIGMVAGAAQVGSFILDLIATLNR